MKTYIFVLSMFFFSSQLLADGTGGKFGIGANGGAISYAGDIKQTTFGSYYDFNVGFWFNDYVGIGLKYGNGFMKAEDDDAYFKTWLWNYSFLLKYKPFPSSPVNPYLLAGYSVIDINPKKKNGSRLPNRAAGVYDKIQYGIPVGAGMSVFFNEWISADLEVIYHYSGTDYLDDIKRGTRNDGWTTGTLGLSLYLGKATDTDGDGIPDKQDFDPTHAEDFDGFEDLDGKPDLDNDNDGIPDNLDQAPLMPEDRDGYKDSDGIPDPDNDGDGVLDVNDKCPGTDNNLDTKEDRDGYMDDDGCPDLDNDGDSIPDSVDQCPDEAEVFNGYNDEDGCPDTKPEIDVEAGKAIILEGITFPSGSATLSDESIKILQKVYQTLHDYPEMEVEIRGYTDNTGNYQNNVSLSQRRADAVKLYLIYRGIKVNRISAKGYGPANPIAPNSTRAGRAQNRRIEFFRVK